MFGMNLGHTRENVVAVVDVGGCSAAIALIAVEKNKPARVIAAERTPFVFDERPLEATAAGVAAQLTAAGEKIQKSYTAFLQNGGAAAKELFVILHAPWVHSRVTRLESKFAENTLITDRIIADMAAKALAAEQNLDKKNLFEAIVIRTELNGYASSKPSRKRAKELAVYALLSESQAGVRQEIETALQKVFPHLIPAFRSIARATVTVLEEVITDSKGYIVIDVSFEGSSIIAIRDGIIAESQLVAEGMRSIVKRVAGSGMPEDALTMIRLLSRDQCSDPACDTIRASMARAEPELVRIFGEAMSKCVVDRRLPNTLILLAHEDVAPWLSKFFARIDFAQFTLTTQPFEVKNLQAKDLAQLVHSEDGFRPDPTLALSCGLVNIEKNHR